MMRISVHRQISIQQALCLTLIFAASAADPQLALAQRFATGGPYTTPAGKSPTAELLRDVGIDQHLGSQLPLDATFRDEAGQSVRLGEYFGDKPVVLALIQYRCPMLCNQVLSGFLKASQAIPLEIGRDYQFIAITFDAREGPELAASKKAHAVKVYRRAGAESGMHFLTGDQNAIDQITSNVGFRYRYVERTDQFAHASGLMIATSDGRLARYLYGIEYSPYDLRLGLVEGGNGRVGSRVDQFLLLCYHYDPLTGKYGLAISRVVRAAGLLTVVVMGIFLFAMFRHEQQRHKLFRSHAVNVASSNTLEVPINSLEP